MMRTRIMAAALLAACTTVPSAPSVLVLPGTGKSFESFQADDTACRQYAQQRIGTTAQQAASDAGLKSATVGAAIGAVGALAGTGAADLCAHEAQRRYDHGYQQCLYAKGHRVPVYGNFVSQGARDGAQVPPPPAGMPPPPPSGVLR
jgi:hypothetical protein